MYRRIREIDVGTEGEKIITTVTKQASEVDFAIKSFLTDEDGDMVIGFDTEWTLVPDSSTSRGAVANAQQSNTAILELCNGKQCLIVQLSRLDYIPRSLLNFLRLPNYAFVGIGIKESMGKLERDYGIGCKNMVELGPFAAKVMKKPRLVGCGVDKLAEEFDLLIVERPMSSVFDDWGSEFPNRKQIKCAAINAYAYYKLGIKLLSSN